MVMLAGSAVFVPALSVTVTVKVKVPLVVGVPESPVLHHTPLLTGHLAGRASCLSARLPHVMASSGSLSASLKCSIHSSRI
jgi:hypothetical protein